MDKFQIVLIKFSIWCRADERTARLMQQNRSIKIDFQIVQFRQWIFTSARKKNTHIDLLVGDFEFFFFTWYIKISFGYSELLENSIEKPFRFQYFSVGLKFDKNEFRTRLQFNVYLQVKNC